MTINSKTFLPFLLVLLLSIGSHADEMSINMIPLKHRPAETLLPSLSPLVTEGGSITAHGNQLIINSTANNLAQLQLVIDELDTPLAQLMISVRHGGSHSGKLNGGQINTRISTGKSTGALKNGTVTLRNGNTQTTTSSNTRVIVRHATTQGMHDNSYQVRTLEGYPAYIQTGKDVPVTNIRSDIYGRTYADQSYKAANKGFYATPRLYENRVTLQISTQNDDYKNGDFKTETLATTVSGKLGEWIAIGGIEQDQQNKESGIGQRYSTTTLSNNTVYLKVDRLP